VQNDTYRRWLTTEFEGYSFDDLNLPSYRKIRCVTYLTTQTLSGRSQVLPVSFGSSTDEEFLDMMLYHRVIEPIAVIEKTVEMLQGSKGHVELTPEQVDLYSSIHFEQENERTQTFIGGYREVAKMQFVNIIELTKQKLLDTLLELDNE
jgi:AbiTii